jgi:predicted CopG family antitoxin
MVLLTEEIIKIINDPKSIKFLGTKTPEGRIHMICVGSMMTPKPDMIVFGTILMKRTYNNLENMKKKGESVSILIAKERNSYEIIAEIKDYQTSDEMLDKINAELKRIGLSAKGIWILEPKEVWNQSASPDARKRIV